MAINLTDSNCVTHYLLIYAEILKAKDAIQRCLDGLENDNLEPTDLIYASSQADKASGMLEHASDLIDEVVHDIHTRNASELRAVFSQNGKSVAKSRTASEVRTNE